MKFITTIITLYIQFISILYFSILLLFFGSLAAYIFSSLEGLNLLIPMLLFIISILPVTYFGIPPERQGFTITQVDPSEGIYILFFVLAIASILAFRSANEIRKGRRRGLIIYSFVVLLLLVGWALDIGFNGALIFASKEGVYIIVNIVMVLSFILSVGVLWFIHFKRQD